jgi:peptidyl-prolyl cis-trans isomerase SurA
VTKQFWTKSLAALASISFAGAPIAVAAQQAAGQPAPAASTNAFGIPDDVTIFTNDNPNVRTATAIVNDFVITGTDIEQRLALVLASSQNEVTEQERIRLRQQILRNLIDETLQIQEAESLELEVTNDQIEQRYNSLATQNFGDSPERMDEYLESVGSSPAALKRQIKGEMSWQNALRRNVIPFVNVSEEEVNEVLERLEASRGTEEFRLGEIYLSATTENREAVLQNAQRIVEQIQQGANFQAYARQFSEATTAAVGGDTGFLRLGTLPQVMGDAVRQMQPGQLVGPLEIPGGFTILLLIDKRQVLTADPRDAILSLKQIAITFDPDTTEEAAGARVEEFGQFVVGLRGCADADSAAAAIGANVVTNDQITARTLPDQLQGIILGLQIGQTTPPFGSIQEGVRVLMLCGRDDPQDVSGPTFDSVMDQIENDRIQKRAQRYLRDLRNDAYIEYN